MRRGKRHFGLNDPLFHPDHRRPMTRREMIAQGFRAGVGTATGMSLFSLFNNPRKAYAELAPDLADLRDNLCGLSTLGAGKIPFICIDLAGGANIAGSNVLVGQQGGQLDTLSTQGYSKLGLPGDMVPGAVEAAPSPTSNGDHIDTTLGLAFHSDSAFLRGILEKTSAATQANINGAVIPARSENDTGNNPHNPMYGIASAGAGGSLLSLIGSRSSASGGNSMAPAMLIDPTNPPTKVDRPSDVTGLVDTGDLLSILNADDAVAVMESIQRVTDMKLGVSSTGLPNDSVLKENFSCEYVKSADLADRFSNPNSLNPNNPEIVGPIFSATEFQDSEFQKTASVMKMVVDGYAGAGTITMGGYDYHTGERATGELRDLRAGRCMGACLEYAATKGVPLMLYVFSDGSVASNGRIDNSVEARGKGEWTGDNSSTAASFFLVYDPRQRPTLLGADATIQARHQQIGWMRPDASVETSATPAANNVTALVDMVVLNYLALHGLQGDFATALPNNTIGLSLDLYTAFEPLASVNNGIIVPLP